MRAPTDAIAAPLFPRGGVWLNGPEQATISRGRPMLIEFFDFCLPHSMRTLPYVRAWHERYAADGLRVISVHSPGSPLAADASKARAAVARLGLEHPVLLDQDLTLFGEYENEGWPVRFLYDGRAVLFEYHYGEGAYGETERAIQQLLGVERKLLAPLRPEDAEGALLAPPSANREGAYSGPYEAGGVWGVFDGAGVVTVNGRRVDVPGPGAYPLVEHERHTAATLTLDAGGGVACVATCFVPGLI
ncbi:MAG TPA: DipZ protein [Solirubrobacteraceae bacterium]|nr:DipZ protein [Solirubrobacteraceae bacterium]